MSKRWKANAVSFWKKCSEFCGEFLEEMRWNAVTYFIYRIHSFQRNFYINPGRGVTTIQRQKYVR